MSSNQVLPSKISDSDQIQYAVDISRSKSKIRRLAERGMATVEYAVGILAAAALALVLLRIFTGSDFLQMLLKFVVGLFQKIKMP